MDEYDLGKISGPKKNVARIITQLSRHDPTHGCTELQRRKNQISVIYARPFG
jgi:hypothetical protein